MGTWEADAFKSKNPDQKEKHKYSTQEVADKLEVSIRTVYNLRISGLLRYEQAFDKAPVYFTDQDIEEYKILIRRGGPTAQ